MSLKYKGQPKVTYSERSVDSDHFQVLEERDLEALAHLQGIFERVQSVHYTPHLYPGHLPGRWKVDVYEEKQR